MRSFPLLLPVTLLFVLAPIAHGGSLVPADQVVQLHVENDPTVSFRIQFAVGSQNDPAGKEGLAEITSSMLSDASTTRNSYEQILDKLYPLAASYNASVAVEQTVFGGRVHKDNLQAYYPLFIDAILRPAFKQEDLDRIKSQTLNYLENILRYSSDEELGKEVLYSSLFTGSGYGHPTEGLISSVKSITLDDVRSFYRKYFTSGNVVIGLGGGYPKSLLDSLQKDLGMLPEGRPVVAQARAFPASWIQCHYRGKRRPGNRHQHGVSNKRVEGREGLVSSCGGHVMAGRAQEFEQSFVPGDSGNAGSQLRRLRLY